MQPLSQRPAPATVAPASLADPAERELHPLSFAQQRIWFVEQLRPGTSAYHIPLARRFRTPMDVAALERSLTEIVRRHAVLRSVVAASEQGEPMQAILPPFPVRLQRADVSSHDIADSERRAIRLMSEETRRPFDLSTGPLIRGLVITLGPADCVLLLVMHHIAFDGWSVGVLSSELARLYGAHANGRPAALPDLPAQYYDFARWQRESFARDDLAAQLSFWTEQLKDAPAVLELPADRPRPSVQTLRGAATRFSIPAPLAQAIRSLSRTLRVTPFMTLLAAFKALLYRYTGQEDLVVGTLVAGRTREETEPLIGCFVNTLPLRTDVSGNPTFAQLVSRVRDVATDAYSHQDVPFEKLIDALHVERGLRHAPLVQVVFGLDNTRTGLASADDGAALQPECASVKFDIEVSVFDDGTRLDGSLLYNTDIFEQRSIDRLIGHFLNVLRAVTVEPNVALSRIPILSEPERRQILEEWNGRHADLIEPTAAGESLHALFERKAAEHPARIAVKWRGGHMTYGDLNEKANALAARLRRAGVGLESLVALLMERSPDVVVAVVGVLKTGASYLPIEPDLPPERVAFLLADAAPAAAITQERHADKLRGFAGAVIGIDRDDPSTEDGRGLRVPAPVTGDNAAYVFYTSGSTGTPKGVTVTHRNVIRLYDACQPWFRFGPDDVWALYHSYAFDLSVWEIWGALLHGGHVVVVPQAIARDPGAMRDLLREERVTVLTQTPTAFKQLSEADESCPPADLSLRVVVFAGEALDLPSLSRWFARHGGRPAMINMYGITETTVHVTYREVTEGDTTPGTGSYVGVPLPDLQLYILDKELQPVPVGVAGEIYVAGPGLARGYFKRPDLTADRFVPNPYASVPGDRLYRSGDLARYRPDGDIEYLGRIDHQVKVRGFRVELGEIEAALAQLPAVKQCAVIARRSSSDERRLVAYVVPQPGERPSATELRSHVASKLPPYMVPGAFVLLDTFPLNANGKLDRKALPDPGSERPELEQVMVPPRTPLELDLAAAFARALGLEQIGIHDSFFALGGDSLRSVRVLAVAKERGIRLSLEQLFEHQTVERLAAVVGRDEPEETISSAASQPFALVSAEDRERMPPDVEDAYPVSVAQQGLLFHMRLNPDEPVYHNVDSLRLHLPRFDRAAFQGAVDATVRRHPILRTSFDFIRYAEPLQLVHRDARLDVGFSDLRELPPGRQQEEVRTCLEVEKGRPFDLESAPLLRLYVHQLTDTDIALTQTELHAIHDGWSTTSMWAEIIDTYSRLLNGEAIAEERLSSAPLRDAVIAERAAMESEASRAYWERKLSDCAPLDLRDPEAPGGATQVRTVAVPITTDVHAGLTALARQAEVPFKSVLLAAHLKALSIASGKHDILTGVVMHGRPDTPDGDKIRGFFLNTVPFRFKVTPSSWVDLVRRTFAAERELLPHQRYPLAALQKKWGKLTLLDTAFMFINFHVLHDLGRKGVQMSVPYSTNDSHFPLMASFNMNKAFWAAENPDVELGIALQYDRARFSAGFMRLLADCYREVIRSMHEEPLRNHAARSFVPEAQRPQLTGWSRSTHVPLDRRTLPQIVDACAQRDPAAVAVVDDTGSTTYGELTARANRLARCLADAGVGAETIVGVYLGRSADLVTALLAIVKAGGAFLPIDDRTPARRAETILQDASARVLITNESGRRQLAGCGCPVLALDADAARVDAQSPDDLHVPIHPRQLAYVIYTSGSTGKPKGVQIEHRSLIGLIGWCERTFRLTPADRTTLLVSPSFDVMVWEVWASLAAGACLCVPSESTRNTPSDLVRWLADRRVTVSVLPTPLAEAVLKEPWPTDARVRVLQTVGDALHSRPRSDHPFAFYNLYGPTENTVYTTSAVVEPSADDELPSIGCPIDNNETYILDRHLQPTPIGVPGELCIGGMGLARGYRGQPDLTADRFLVNPFSDEPGARLYRTGDLARYRKDGTIEYLGRLDTQVKIRGFRVETSEVEAALQSHPAVEHAAVVVNSAAAQKRLVAYFTAPGADLTGADLKAYLGQTLPDYMVPAVYVKLDRMPSTLSGKIDRNALPPPRPDADDAPPPAARNDLERRIAEIWAQVLHHHDIGIHDNFFDIGGDSLRLLELHRALREALDARIEMMDLVEYSTIATFAQRFAQTHQAPAPGKRRGLFRRHLLDRAKRLTERPSRQHTA